VKKPLQHRILDLLADGPMHYSVLCERLAPDHTNRVSISAALKAMKFQSKLRTTRLYEDGKSGSSAIWEIAPQVSNALSECWPMPVLFPPVPGTVREHRGQM
jgi:hypothetical protein